MIIHYIEFYCDVRISEIKEISMAKEANYEMISHLGSLDQEFYQGTIEKLRQENVVLKEENKLLKELAEVGSANEKMNFLNNVKADRIQIMASGALSPCIIKSMEDEQFIHIVMPMQVQ